MFKTCFPQCYVPALLYSWESAGKRYAAFIDFPLWYLTPEQLHVTPRVNMSSTRQQQTCPCSLVKSWFITNRKTVYSHLLMKHDVIIPPIMAFLATKLDPLRGISPRTYSTRPGPFNNCRWITSTTTFRMIKPLIDYTIKYIKPNNINLMRYLFSS